MGGKSTPKPPDYVAAAEAQAQSSMENLNQQNYANRPTQNTPFGSTSWQTQGGVDPATGQRITQWTQNTTLNPESQRALDSQLALTAGRSEIGAGMLDRIRSEFGPIVDFDQFDPTGGRVTGGQFRGELGDSGDFMGQAGNALMSQFTSRMQPQFDRDQAQLDTTLRNRGLKPGDEAYDQAIADLRQSQGDQFNQAMYQAQQLSAGEASRLQDMDQQSMDAFNRANSAQFGQDMAASSYDTQRRQQQIAEMLQQRGWSLNEANALISGQQVAMPSMPSFNQSGRAETTQYSQAARDGYQAELDAFNAEQAALSGMMGAITSPFSFGMSDRRLKTDIKAVGTLANGLTIYEFRYKGDDKLRKGVMADEVRAFDPSAVVRRPSGFDMVNYTKIGAEHLLREAA